MLYRVLGRTGVNVSPECLGSDNFGDAPPADEATAIINRALDAGINRRLLDENTLGTSSANPGPGSMHRS